MNNKAAMPNPSLQHLEVLIGKWKTLGTHPYFPDSELHGQVVFEWIEGGAFIKMSSTINHPDFPDGISIMGSDDDTGAMFMLYFDERGVSRKYDFRIDGNGWKWWRENPKFSQRFAVTIEGETMIGKGEMRKDGGGWEDDLSLMYHRM